MEPGRGRLRHGARGEGRCGVHPRRLGRNGMAGLVRRIGVLGIGVSMVCCGALLAACSSAGEDAGPTGEGASATSSEALTPDPARGRDLWFKETFGGGWFLTTFLGYAAPPEKRLRLGFDTALAIPRAQRF